MPRNLVICCDGTNNQFGPENTSVVRLTQVLHREADTQLVYYDPGVGTLPEPGGWSKLGKKLSEWIDLAFGTGLLRKVEQAYSYLMDFWEPEDRVFLFGFSRGAYTARVLGGMLHSLGLLPRGSSNLVPYAVRLYKSVRHNGRSDEGNGVSGYWRLCNDFRWTFARHVPGGGDQRRFPIHFLGIWDTVSSVGWIWDPASFPYTARNPSISIVRHAVSIDERRAFFRQNLVHEAEGQDLKEYWFPGVHADVGGGYPETEGGLWRMPFQWILDEAQNAGLLLNPGRLAQVLQHIQPPERPWAEPQHESLTPLWWLAEFFPKLHWRTGASFRVPELGLGRYRFISANTLIHKSALLRMRDTNYAPPNLSRSFLEQVRALEHVPEALAFE